MSKYPYTAVSTSMPESTRILEITGKPESTGISESTSLPESTAVQESIYTYKVLHWYNTEEIDNHIHMERYPVSP